MAVTAKRNQRLWTRIMLLVGTAIAVPAINACSPVAPVEMAVEDRSGGDIKDDTEIKAGIIADINNRMGTGMAASLNVDVYEQVVMLTGEVETDADFRKAESIARAHPGVRRLYNEIQVVPEGTDAEGSWIDDVVVKQKFYGKLATTAGVNHTNWRYRSVNGVLYLFGRPLSQGEMDRVLAIAKDTENVRRVVNHAFVRPK